MPRFHVYRYQILPIEQEGQLPLFDSVTPDISVLSVEQLRERKNDFFAQVLLTIPEFTWSRAEIVHRMVYQDDQLILIRIGADRRLTRTTREFEQEKLDDWPSALLAFDNDPSVQKVAIEVEYKAFRKTQTLASIVQRNLNTYLRDYRLHVTFHPLFDRAQFWDLVEQYRGKITQVVFEMVSPNMANISKNLRFDLRELHKTTNTQNTRLALESDKNSSLTLSQNDTFVGSLVDYSSEGGGNVSLKIRGINRKMTTNDTITEFNVEGLEISSLTPENAPQVTKMLKGLLNG